MDAIIDWIAGAFMAVAALFGSADASTGYQGYVEADYVRVGVPDPGTLELLAVRRGDMVQAGDLLFALDDTAERAARDEAAARLAQAAARLADLRKGERPEEIAALEAERRQAEASLALTKSELDRQQKLFDTKVTAESRLDEARSAYRRDVARIAELDAEIATAGLGGRSDAVAAAAADVAAARAALAQAEWRLSQRSAAAAMAALVDDTLYAEGEHVGAGKPIVSLLPPGNLFVRFFVPETELGRIAVGQRFTVTCDGCAGPIAARVSFVSPDAEYTPPVIYSEGRREKLVFMIEARPLDAAPDLGAVLHPGQPVTVTPDATEPAS
jgi:HlyD family secretion protein